MTRGHTYAVEKIRGHPPTYLRLAFDPEGLLHSVVLKARKDLGLLPPSTPSTPSSPSPSPFLLARQNSASRILGGGGGGNGLPLPSSWAPPSVFTWSSSTNGNGSNDINGVVDDLQGGEVIKFVLTFYPDMAGDCQSPYSNGEGMLFPYTGMNLGMNRHHRRSYSVANRCLNSEVGANFGWRPCLYFASGSCKNGCSCRFLHGLPDAVTAATMAGNKMGAVMRQQFHELLLRSKSQRISSASQLMVVAATFPNPDKCMNFMLQPY